MKNITDRPLVSLITVNYNGRNYLEQLYDSLQRLTYSPVEFILVDNASNDDSVEFVQKHYPQVRIVRNRENYMFARGNNEGIKVSRGEIICLINNDIKVDPQFLEPVVKKFVLNSDMAACQPKVLDLGEPDTFEYAGACGGYVDRYGFPFMRGRLFYTMEKDRGQYDKDREIFWSTGACFFIRTDILEEVGRLDENFVMHMEEIDLCWRIHHHGYKIFVLPASKIWHKGGGTLSAENPQKIYWNYRNNIFLLAKNLAVINLLRILVLRLLFDSTAMVREFIRLKPANGWAIIKAYLWLLSHLKLILNRRYAVQNHRRRSDREIFRLIYPGSVVWEYFIRKRRKFSDLNRVKQLEESLRIQNWSKTSDEIY